MNERILLIRTGGTMDSEAYADPKNPPKYVKTLKGKDSLIMPMVAKMPHQENVDGLSWGEWHENRFVKDSQKFTAGNMKALATIIKKDDRKYFILTHGTDAMVKNALMLQEELKGSDKVVAFVGSMVPLSMHEQHESDGVESLHFAIEHITEQSPGVHVLGRDSTTKRLTFFDPQQVEKNREESKDSLKFTLRPVQR